MNFHTNYNCVFGQCCCHQFRTGCTRCGGAFTTDHQCPMSYWDKEDWDEFNKKQEELTKWLLENKDELLKMKLNPPKGGADKI